MPTKNRLTDATKRHKILPITLGSIMVKIIHDGQLIQCETPEEAIKILQHIKREHNQKHTAYAAPTHAVWNNRVFWQFVDSLGQSQKDVLELLLPETPLTDTELRKALSLDSNQQLAGVLSGISKQAAALDIPARAVFKIENEYKSGQITKSYVIAPEFHWIAMENNWEGD